MIDNRLNFADAHNRLRPSDTLVSRLKDGLLYDIWQRAERADYSSLLDQFNSDFSRLGSQSLVNLGPESIFHCYASSVAMGILASSLRSLNWSVSLIEPTFDNIPDLLRQAGVRLHSLPEDQITNVCLGESKSDCIFITMPNNPTGQGISLDQMAALFERAAADEVTLVIDRSFSHFDTRFNFDLYSLAKGQPGLVLILIEDTGKVFPSLDQKIGFLSVLGDDSPRRTEIRDAIARHHSSVLLNVSQFTLALVSEFCRDAAEGGIDLTRQQISYNRTMFRSAFRQIGIAPACIGSRASVDLFNVASLGTARTVVSRLMDHDIHVLAADKFYWSSPDADSGQIRVALARDPKLVAEACERITRIQAARQPHQRRRPGVAR